MTPVGIKKSRMAEIGTIEIGAADIHFLDTLVMDHEARHNSALSAEILIEPRMTVFLTVPIDHAITLVFCVESTGKEKRDEEPW